MSLHKCPECGNEVATNSTCAGSFEVPPRLFCYHTEGNDEAYEMEVLNEGGIDTDQKNVHKR